MNDKFISIMTERIVQGFDPLQIILFGSQARGDANQQSDIDLIVVFAELAMNVNGKLCLDILFGLSARCWPTYPWRRIFLFQHLKSWNAAARGSDRCCGMPNKRVKSFGRI